MKVTIWLKTALPAEASRALAFYRLVYFGFLTYYFFSVRDSMSDIAPIFDSSANYPGLFSLFDRAIFDPNIVKMAYPLWLFSLFMTSIGLMTRVSSLVALALGWWIMAGSYSNGLISHQDVPHFLILLIFAVSDCGRHFSLDNLFSARKLRLPWEYQVPIVLLRFIFVAVFVGAAISKIRNGAFAGMFEGESSDVFARANVWFLGFPFRADFHQLNVILVKYTYLAKISLVAVFCSELLAPLLLNKNVRWFLLGFYLIFQVLGTFTLYIDFLHSFIPIYVFWLPIEEKIASVRKGIKLGPTTPNKSF